MPRVGNRSFPYSPEGRKAAKQARKNLSSPDVDASVMFSKRDKKSKPASKASVHVKGNVPRQLRDKFGKDWRQKAYGHIGGYEPGLAKKIAALKSKTDADPTKLQGLQSTFGMVKDRRRELGVGKAAKKPDVAWGGSAGPYRPPTGTSPSTPSAQPGSRPPGVVPPRTPAGVVPPQGLKDRLRQKKRKFGGPKDGRRFG